MPKMLYRVLKINAIMLLLTAVFLISCSSDSDALPTTLPTAALASPTLSIVSEEVTPLPEITATAVVAMPTPFPMQASSLPAVSFQPIRERFEAEKSINSLDLVDLTGAGLPDIIISSFDHQVYAISADYGSFGQLFPAVVHTIRGGDLDNDTLGDIFIGRDDYLVTAVEGSFADGQFFERATPWPYQSLGTVNHILPVTLPENQSSLVVGTVNGYVTRLNAAGDLQWEMRVDDSGITWLAQLSSEPLLIAATTESGQLVLLDTSGNELWRRELDAYISAAIAVDVDQNGVKDIVIGSENGTLSAITSDNNELWQSSVSGSISAIASGQFVPNESPQIIVGSGIPSGIVTALDAEGREVWQTAIGSGINDLVVDRIVPDAHTEVLIGTEAGEIIVLDKDGRLRGQYGLPYPISYLRVADLTGTGEAELIAAAGSYLYVLEPVMTTAVTPIIIQPSPSPPLPTPDENGGIALLALGDTSLAGMAEKQSHLHGVDYPFMNVSPLLSMGDVIALNLNSPLSINGVPSRETAAGRASPRMVDSLANAGIDVVFLANDGVSNYGTDALLDSIAELDSRNIAHTGAGANIAEAIAPIYVENGGVRIAFLAFTNAVPEGAYADVDRAGVAPANEISVETAVKQALESAEYVVVALHTAPVYLAGVTDSQVALAHTAVDAGASLIIGYGAGNQQETEQYGDGFIVYNLGDFIGDVEIDQTDSGILRAVFETNGEVTPSIITIHPSQQPALATADGELIVNASFSADTPETNPASNPPPAVQMGDLPHYDLNVNLDYVNHTVQVDEEVSIINNSSFAWDEVVFNVSTAYWRNIFNLGNVSVLLDGAEQEIVPVLDNTMLHIPLPHPLSPQESVVINIAYTLSLPELNPYGWGPTGNAGWAYNVTQMGDWYPALVPYDAEAAVWKTWEYTAVGDPVRNDLADFDLTIYTAPDVHIAAPGYMGTEDNGRQYQLNQARAFAFLASPNYVVHEAVSRGVPIKFYAFPSHSGGNQAVLDGIVKSIALFSDLYGPYPYDEFVMAENGFLTAMEYSGMVSLSSFAFDTYTNTESLLVSLTAHEVAHQWWYGAVGNDQIYEPWLDESLCMFSELLFYEEYYPQSTDWWWSFRVDQWNPGGYVDVSIYDYDSSSTFIHNMYGMASYFMYDLHETMGEAAFQQFIQAYYRQYTYQIATAEDFFTLAQLYSDVDLTPLIKEYFRETVAN